MVRNLEQCVSSVNHTALHCLTQRVSCASAMDRQTRVHGLHWQHTYPEDSQSLQAGGNSDCHTGAEHNSCSLEASGAFCEDLESHTDAERISCSLEASAAFCEAADLYRVLGNWGVDKTCLPKRAVHTFPVQSLQCSPRSKPSEKPNHNALSGVLAQLVDDVAGNLVFHDNLCRPRGHVTLNTLHDMKKHNELNSSSRGNWHQFLQVWLEAGWSRFDLIVLVDERRPLLWGHPQLQEHIATVHAKQMEVYASEYSSGQGLRHVELQKALHSLLDVVQTHFSTPSAVLVPVANISCFAGSHEVNLPD